MPIKNGIETAKEIITNNDKMKVIFLSADDSIIHQTHSIGAYSFFIKPFKLNYLENVIESALNNKNS